MAGKRFLEPITVKEERGEIKDTERDSHSTDHLNSTTILMANLISRPREVRTWLATRRGTEPKDSPIVGHETRQSLLWARRTRM